MPAHGLPGLPRYQTGSAKGPRGSSASLVRDLQNRVDLRRRSVLRCGPRCLVRACGCACCMLTLCLAAPEGPETCPASASSARDRLGFACSGLLSIGGQFGWSARLASALHRRRHSKPDAGRWSQNCFLLDECSTVELSLAGALRAVLDSPSLGSSGYVDTV